MGIKGKEERKMQGFIIENAQVYDPIANRIQKRPIAFQNGRFISPEKAEIPFYLAEAGKNWSC